jgi:hypothetical protein
VQKVSPRNFLVHDRYQNSYPISRGDSASFQRTRESDTGKPEPDFPFARERQSGKIRIICLQECRCRDAQAGIIFGKQFESPFTSDLSGRLGNLVGADAAGANLELFHAARSLHDPDLLKVGKGNLLGSIMGMAHVVSHQRSFAADFTDSRHKTYSLERKNIG